MASEISFSEMKILIQQLCDIVGCQAHEIINLQKNMKDLSTELMSNVNELKTLKISGNLSGTVTGNTSQLSEPITDVNLPKLPVKMQPIDNLSEKLILNRVNDVASDLKTLDIQNKVNMDELQVNLKHYIDDKLKVTQNSIMRDVTSQIEDNSVTLMTKVNVNVEMLQDIGLKLTNAKNLNQDKLTREIVTQKHHLESMQHKLDTIEHDNLLLVDNSQQIKRDIEENTHVLLKRFQLSCLEKINSAIDKHKQKVDSYSDICAVVQENVLSELGTQLHDMGKQLVNLQTIEKETSIEATFVWRNGRLIQNLVIWDFETLNTDDSLIKWNCQEPFIYLSTPGIYGITLAFFTPHKPVIKVILSLYQD